MSMKMTFAVNSVQITDKLAALDTKMRRKGMRKVGNEAAKVLLPHAELLAPRRTGWLQRSLAKKISIYNSGTIVWAGAGPKAGFKILAFRKKGGRIVSVATLQYKGRILKKLSMRKGRSLEEARLLIWPSKYAHLAGPGRRANFIQKTIAQTASTVRSRMAQTFSEELGG